MSSPPDDPILDALLEEVLGGVRPPNLTSQILASLEKRSAADQPLLNDAVDYVLTAMHLGGEFDRLEFLVTGLAFVQAFASLDQAQAGQVVVSLQAWTHLENDFVGQPLQMGSVLVEGGPTSVERPPS